MRLYLLRHGLALSKEQGLLGKEGESDIEKVGHFHFESGWLFNALSRVVNQEQYRQLRLLLRSCRIDTIEKIDGINPNDDAPGFWSSQSHWRQNTRMANHLLLLAKLTGHLLDTDMDTQRGILTWQNSVSGCEYWSVIENTMGDQTWVITHSR